jgi:hypothetical protein
LGAASVRELREEQGVFQPMPQLMLRRTTAVAVRTADELRPKHGDLHRFEITDAANAETIALSTVSYR